MLRIVYNTNWIHPKIKPYVIVVQINFMLMKTNNVKLTLPMIQDAFNTNIIDICNALNVIKKKDM